MNRFEGMNAIVIVFTMGIACVQLKNIPEKTHSCC